MDNIECLFCVDINKDMLKNLEKWFLENNVNRYKTIIARAADLPFDSNYLNVIVSFNSIHHFDLCEFLVSAKKSLKPGGYIFLYTRTKEQNKQIIWGKYFPKFNEKETRLYNLQDIVNCATKVGGLNLLSIKEFKYKRLSTLERLVYLAENHHYSTFILYSQKDFNDSLETFKKNIKKNFNSKVRWEDMNTLIVLTKGANK